MVDKKPVLTRGKICLTKNLFLIVIKVTVFLSLTIHHIHYFECIFFHQSKSKKSCLFHKLLFYELYFKSYLSNATNIFYSRKHLCIRYDLLSQQHFYSQFFAFLSSLLSFTKYEYIFGFNPTNSSITTPVVSFFNLPTTNLF